MVRRNRVLVVGGEDQRRREWCELLESHGYRANAAAHPDEALRSTDPASTADTLAILLAHPAQPDPSDQTGLAGLAALRQHLPHAAFLIPVPNQDRSAMLETLRNLDEPSRTPNEPSAADLRREEREILRNASHDAVLRIDLAGTIVGWNPAAEQIYGYPADEIVGQPLSTLLPDEHRTELSHALDRLRRGQPIDQPRSVHLDREHRRLELDLRGRPLLDPDGRPAAGLILARDRTRAAQLEQRLLEATIAEQRRIGQDLHDGLGQELTGIAFLLRCLRDELNEHGAERQAASADQIISYINEAITHAKALVRGLRPAGIEDGGLVHALRNLTEAASRTHRIECVLDADENAPAPDPDTALHLYYIAREALNNAVHHGRAQRVRLQFETMKDSLRLRIRDDGVGLHADGIQNPGSGLDIMNSRAQSIGGSLHVQRAAERGTEVACHVHLPDASASPPSSNQ